MLWYRRCVARDRCSMMVDDFLQDGEERLESRKVDRARFCLDDLFGEDVFAIVLTLIEVVVGVVVEGLAADFRSFCCCIEEILNLRCRVAG